ncbi:MAG: histidinol phosphatase [Fluviicola sp.]|nr:histidinol phosphatase [Fluviicola sp.]MBP6270895.1 histidinol phosphatase [Fluviicola sp.]
MGFFSKLFSKNKPKKSFADFVVDVHSHLLPGIDDGAKSMEDSIAMIRTMIDMGYQKLVITPHVMAHRYQNSSRQIQQVFTELQAEVTRLGLSIVLEVSAEYYLDETLFERIVNGDLLPFSGNHILFECSFRNESLQLFDLVFQLKAAGYQPVIAHFERYVYYHNRIEIAQQLRSMGCLIQVNLLSFSGYYGKLIQRQAEELLANNLVDVVGTDCHRLDQLLHLTAKKNRHAIEKCFSASLINPTFR